MPQQQGPQQQRLEVSWMDGWMSRREGEAQGERM